MLTNIGGYQADDPDLGVTINRPDLEQVMMGAVNFDDQIAAGKAKLNGNKDVYEQLKSMLIRFELGFELMSGSGDTCLSPKRTPFQQDEPADTPGG
jgi:alkyl sulfatase BDS1-like metallo-beta-lactamase superfamily hydrolase